MNKNIFWRVPRQLLSFVLAALLIEHVDELVDGATGAAWPFFRQDFGLSYVQVGLLMTIPAVLANLIEPLLGLWADMGRRRHIILFGGVCFAVSLALVAGASGFWPLLLAQILFYPASGAFVALTQAAWMDAEPQSREQNMALWTLSGSLGNVIGPLLVGVMVALGFGWRPVFIVLAVLSVLALLMMWRTKALENIQHAQPEEQTSFRESLQGAWQELRRGEVIEALVLLESSDLMLDIFRAFLALYFVDAVGASATQAGLAIAVLTGVGLLGDILIVPVLKKVSGVAFVRWSALVVAALFVGMLLTSWVILKLVLIGLIGLFTAGWYAVLKARLYELMPERSGTVITISSITGFFWAGVPALLGVLADQFGVANALWALLLGPMLLVWRLPRVRLCRI